ncbi:MAG TPA: HD domain-containing protein, partial [Deinococcales bacterium]|nr:HD domain-containing protein [Deinococcales bacterium]
QYRQPEAHTRRVRELARSLFDGLEPLHGFGGAEARLLDEAALLHDIGMALGYHDHHKHGAYLVGAGSLPGTTHREQALLLLLVQYHRKGEPKLGPFKDVAEPDDARVLLQLTACLRLAEYLERSRAGRVRGVRASIAQAQVTLHLDASEVPHVEAWEARKQGSLFRKAFGRELVIEASGR